MVYHVSHQRIHLVKKNQSIFVYSIFVTKKQKHRIQPGFQPKTSSFRLPYQHHSPLPIALESCSNPQKIRQVFSSALKNIFFDWGLQIFCEWCHKWSSFRAILAHVTWPMTQPLCQIISLNFSLETRLESESFQPLIDFLAFLVQKSWSKINKLIN